jgi:hypothetical protein
MSWFSKAVKGVQKGVSQATGSLKGAVGGATGALQGAVGNVAKGAQGVVQGAQQVGSGDLRGLQTMGGAVVNTGSGLVGNSADLTRASIDALYGAPGMGMLKGTPLDGMIRGNLKGAVGSAEGMIRGNVAGIQDLPTDIGKGAQHVLDQAGNIVGEIGKGLGGLLGGGGGGGGSAGGITAPQYYKDLAKKQAEYGMNLPDQFQKYEGERFTAPSDRTTQAETAIYNNNANSQQAAFDRAGQLMNQGNQYTSTNPTAQNYNAVDTKGAQTFTSQNYGNANANLAGPVNYNQGKSFESSLQQFSNPYTSQVVDQSIADLDRARKMTNQDISGAAAKSGAFGGSREALMRSENNRNFLDRAGALAGQLRQQGFNTASQMAQDEQMKRLGLTASDTQNVRGYQSQGNLAGQSLTAQSANQTQQLGAQSYNQAADRELRAGMSAQDLGASSYENQQRNALTNAANQAQFGQAANNAALSAAQLQGQLGGQMDDRTRQQMYDRLQMGQNQDARNQAQADFNYQQFVDETQNFPQQYINNLNNAGGLGSRLIYTQQPTSGGGGQKGGLSGILGGALSGAAAGGPWGALIGGGLGALGAGVPSNMAGLDKFTGLFGDAPVQYNNAPTLGPNSGFGPD